MPKLSVGICIPTYEAAHHLPHCLPFLINSPLKPRLLIIDSSSKDETVSLAKKDGVETLVIPKTSFNHGLTRELGRRYLATDIIVMLTQDAYATSPDMIEKLIEPLIQGTASISYGRQLPHTNAHQLASFSRAYNYPTTSHIRGLQDAPHYGAYTFFCSNSCAAYLNSALDEMGGFQATSFGEDTIAVAKLLHLGHRIAYVAEAEVRHSHNYTLKEEFLRHFLMGKARHSHHSLLRSAGHESKRGQAYLLALLKDLVKNKPSLIPYALLHTGAKYLGYRLGAFKK